MTPSEFKSRYLASLPEVPDDLDLDDVFEFVLFPAEQVALLRIHDADRRLLVEVGLPCDAAPMLTFGPRLQRYLPPLDEFPDSVVIGHNNYGDAICIDQADSGSVVYYDHESRTQRVIINSSVVQLAESLCLFSEFLRTQDAEAFVKQLASIDPVASVADSFWLVELSGKLGM